MAAMAYNEGHKHRNAERLESDSECFEVSGKASRQSLLEESTENIEKYKKISKLLDEHISYMEHKSAKKMKLTEQDHRILQEARRNIEKMGERNSALLAKIEEYENRMDVVEIICEKFEDIMPVEGQIMKSDDNELLKKKQEPQCMKKELEERNESIEKLLLKLNEKLENLSNELQEVKSMVANMGQAMQELLLATKEQGKKSQPDPRENLKRTNQVPGRTPRTDGQEGVIGRQRPPQQKGRGVMQPKNPNDPKLHIPWE